jgi:hypothetical protein
LDDVPTVRVAAWDATEIEKVVVAVWAVGVEESVTFTPKLAPPEVVGVPEITPLDERLRPAGREPELSVQAYGGVPPEAARVAEYAVPTVAPGREVVVIASAVEVVDNGLK